MKKQCNTYIILILMVVFVGLANGQTVTNPYPIPSSYLDTDVALTANSDVKVPSQKAVKAYVGSASITGSANSLKSPATTGLLTVTGMGAGTTRAKTVRDADDTILELGGSYTPSATWNWTSASVTWPTFNQSTTGTAAHGTTWGPYAGITGPTQARTFTLPDAAATLLYDGKPSGAFGTASSATGSILLYNAGNANAFTIQPGATGTALSWTLPIAAPGGNNYLLNASTAGVLGYTNPATFLPVAGGTMNGNVLVSSTNNISFNALGGEYLYSPTTGVLGYVSRGAQKFWADSNNNDGDVNEYEFYTGEAAGSGTPKVVIRNNGNVSIYGNTILDSTCLTDGTFTLEPGAGNWGVTAGWDVTFANNKANFDIVSGAGNLTQAAAKMVGAVSLVPNRWYKTTYTVSNSASSPAATITTAVAAAATSLTLTDGAQVTYFKSAAAPGTFTINATAGVFTLDGISCQEVQDGSLALGAELKLGPTIIPPGTTGNATINKASGRVNIAALGTTVTVTNNLVTGNSCIYAVCATADTTAYVKNVVPGTGSFVINLGEGATAETAINWMVVN